MTTAERLRERAEAALTEFTIDGSAPAVAVAAPELVALLDVVEAARAYHEAQAGVGHPDVDHDQVLHEVGLHDGSCPRRRVDDCAACAGAEYGSEAALTEYLAALDA